MPREETSLFTLPCVPDGCTFASNWSKIWNCKVEICNSTVHLTYLCKCLWLIENDRIKNKQRALFWYINLKASITGDELRYVPHNTKTNQFVNVKNWKKQWREKWRPINQKWRFQEWKKQFRERWCLANNKYCTISSSGKGQGSVYDRAGECPNGRKMRTMHWFKGWKQQWRERLRGGVFQNTKINWHVLISRVETTM